MVHSLRLTVQVLHTFEWPWESALEKEWFLTQIVSCGNQTTPYKSIIALLYYHRFETRSFEMTRVIHHPSLIQRELKEYYVEKSHFKCTGRNYSSSFVHSLASLDCGRINSVSYLKGHYDIFEVERFL